MSRGSVPDMKIVVVGAGVSGLTCAVALLEAGWEVAVLTAGAPAGTVSAVAGGDGGPGVRLRRRAQPGLGTGIPTGGVPEARRAIRRPACGWWRGRLLAAPEPVPACRRGSPRYPATARRWPCRAVAARVRVRLRGRAAIRRHAWRTWAWAGGWVQTLGGSIQQRVVTSLGEIDADVVVNCSGLGSRQLAGDDAVQPVWGQHVLVDAPFVDEFVFEGGASADGISVVPHCLGVLLGGVRRHGRNALMPDQQIAAETSRGPRWRSRNWLRRRCWASRSGCCPPRAAGQATGPAGGRL